MSHTRESCARGTTGRGKDMAPTLTKKSMPPLGPLRVTKENLYSLDQGLTIIAKGLLLDDTSEGGEVDPTLIVKHRGLYQFQRIDDYPRHFPLDEYLFPFI